MQDIEMLVNKENLLGEDYIPDDLVETDENENNFHNYADSSLKPMVSKKIIPYLQALQKAAKKEGLRDIIVDSGYRSFEYQKQILDSFIQKYGYDEAIRRAAIPGSSEHQTGLAFDIAYMDNGVYIEDTSEDDPEIKWLKDNSYKFGFILRYPEDKEDITGFKYERWHYRYVGIELATLLYNEDITLEEYYEKNYDYPKVLRKEN